MSQIDDDAIAETVRACVRTRAMVDSQGESGKLWNHGTRTLPRDRSAARRRRRLQADAKK
jgi:hypothetical protein